MIIGTEEMDAIKKRNFEYMGYALSQEEVTSMLANSTSVKEAARATNISYPTLKKYAKMYIDPHTGKSLFDLFKNQSGKGVKRNFDKLKAFHNLDSVFKEKQIANAERIAKLKEIVISKNLISLYCNKCGFVERRLTDLRPPLLLNFINKNRTDWKLENLEFLCYNCYFLHIGDPLSSNLIKKIEAHEFDNEIFKEKLENFHQLDDVYLNHLKDLGLDDGGDVIEVEESDIIDYDEDDCSEFIDLV